jgi:hypothetical protein
MIHTTPRSVTGEQRGEQAGKKFVLDIGGPAL